MCHITVWVGSYIFIFSHARGPILYELKLLRAWKTGLNTDFVPRKSLSTRVTLYGYFVYFLWLVSPIANQLMDSSLSMVNVIADKPNHRIIPYTLYNYLTRLQTGEGLEKRKYSLISQISFLWDHYNFTPMTVLWGVGLHSLPSLFLLQLIISV